MSLKIKGLQKTSLIDYPPYTSCVVFLADCDFRCGFCQNPGLIVGLDKDKTISQKESFDFLSQRRKWLEGVVISGGEPCINDDLIEFISKIKKLSYNVKLDTNGTNPLMIKELINKKLIDYIAMDIKGSLEKYDDIANVKVNKRNIKQSVKIIIGSGIEYEFRMTAVPTLHNKQDFEEIGRWLKGAKRFYIQQFRNKVCLDKSFEKIKPFSRDELEEFKEILQKYINKLEIRQ